jgi:hypothetical protein
MLLYHCTDKSSVDIIKSAAAVSGVDLMESPAVESTSRFGAGRIVQGSQKRHGAGMRNHLSSVLDVEFNGESSLNLARVKEWGCNSVRVPRNGNPGTEYSTSHEFIFNETQRFFEC